jgi:hypothetical protein
MVLVGSRFNAVTLQGRTCPLNVIFGPHATRRVSPGVKYDRRRFNRALAHQPTQSAYVDSEKFSDFLRTDSCAHLFSITSLEKSKCNLTFIRVDKQKELAVRFGLDAFRS